MKRECKEVLKKNNKREKVINKENMKIYTDMIVYMRGSDISEYDQELVRADLIELIIDGQERNDDIKKIMGGNYKEICDEIISAFPKKSTKQKFMDTLEISFNPLVVLVFISIIQNIIINFAKNNKIYIYELTLGKFLSIILYTSISVIIVKFICKNSFNEKKKNNIIEFLKYWIITMLIIGIGVALEYYLKYIIIQISIVYVIIFLATIFILGRIVSSKV